MGRLLLSGSTVLVVAACLATPSPAGAAVQGCSVEASPPKRGVELTRDKANVPIDGRLVVSPAAFRSDAALDPGATLNCELVIRSRRAAPTTFDVQVRLVRGSRSDDGPVDIVDAAGSTNLVRPAAARVRLAPREVATVPVRVRVPPASMAGYLALVVTPRSAVAGGNGTLGVRSGVLVPLLLRVRGAGSPSLALQRVRAPLVRVGGEPWTLQGRLSNDGQVFATPDGSVVVRSLFGGEVARLPLEARVLLPGAAVPVETRWSGVPWVGLYRVEARVEAGNGGVDSVERRWLVALPPWWVTALAVVSGMALVVHAARRRRRRPSSPQDDDDSLGYDELA